MDWMFANTSTKYLEKTRIIIFLMKIGFGYMQKNNLLFLFAKEIVLNKLFSVFQINFLAKSFKLIAFVIAFLLNISVTAVDIEANQVERPLLLLQCKETPKPICQAVFQALSQIAPRYALQINPKIIPSGSLLIILDLNKTNDTLTGSLSWRDDYGLKIHGDDLSQIYEPSKITIISHAQAKMFAQKLIKATPKLKTLLLQRSIK